MVILRLLLVVLRIVIPVLIVYGLWRSLRPRWAFQIVADESGVRSHDGISTPEQRRLLDLFYKMRFVEGKVTVKGRYDKNGRLELKFIGAMSEEGKQQVRNFIVNEF